MHSIMILNQLVGNYDWKGGNQVGGSHWDEFAGGLKTVPGGVSPTGIPITRVGKDYETDAPNLFALDGGYPARRQWFPYAMNGNYQEVIPSANDGYPYKLKALITYWNAWPYSTPAAKETFESYVSKRDGAGYDLDCFVAIDTHIGETSGWADYILPDVTYLEKWAQPHPTPAVLAKASPLRQPIVGNFDGKACNAPFEPNGTNDHVGVLPNAKHVEDILIALAKALGLPGVGANSFTDGASLDNAWDWAKKTIEAVAGDSGFSVAEVIAKGGVFADPGTEYDGDHVTKKYGKHLWFYLEELAKQKDSISGQNWDGLPKYEPASFADGTLVDDSAQYPYRIITYKHVLHAMGRTACLPWLMAMQQENFVEINSADAAGLGVETGDEVKLTSPSNAVGIIGKAQVTEGIRPGVVAVQHSFGHWQVGSVTHKEDGVAQNFDPTRGTGLLSNLVMRQDDVVGNVSLQDRVGGSAAFYDSNVNITKVI
jgi:anaerobic selenocysteine-containing dehydrogenase